MMVSRYREDMRMNNIDTPEKVSEYFYNIVKSELQYENFKRRTK